MKSRHSLLKRVEKPSRYIGGELHSIIKPKEEVDLRFLFSFPDLYEVGMSHLGTQIIYFLLNQMPGVQCERLFFPASDMEALIQQGQIGLESLEQKLHPSTFDLWGFTLQYELSYTNVLQLLHLADIPLRWKDRNENHPLIVAGGSCAYNPEPMAAFFDLYYLGEAEECLPKLLDLYRENPDRLTFLQNASHMRGIYVPRFYQPRYEDGRLLGYDKLYEEALYPIQKVFVQDLRDSFYPDRLILPFMDTIHDRGVVEIFRGCTRGCRFCQAGMVYRPVRERSPEEIEKLTEQILQHGGYEEFSLSSLSTLDYSAIDELVEKLSSKYSERKISISLPSLRLDSFSLNVLQRVASVRKSGLTFAPEAGTQRLRDVINKNVTEQDLTDTMRELFKLGWKRIKLYFILGLPTENFEDVQGIEKIAKDLRALYRSLGLKGYLNLTVSTSSLVPKPFTPFQWVEQTSREVIEIRQQYLRKALNTPGIRYQCHDIETTLIEGILARGDREMANVIEAAWKRGAKMDGWKEHFHFDYWMQAMEEFGITMEEALRSRDVDEFLPWDILDIGVKKSFLQEEYLKAMEASTTRDCREGCLLCGMNETRTGGICFAGTTAVDQKR